MEPVIYFRRPDGHIFLAPYTSFPTPPGCDREYADTLYKVHDLERRLVAQEREQWEREALQEEMIGARVTDIRDRLYQRMCSGSTDPYERDFIREWLKLRDEKKRKKYADFLKHRQMYLSALHNDTPKDRRVDEESVNLDRVNF